MPCLCHITSELSETAICSAGQDLAINLLSDYPFDADYEKIVYLTFMDELQAQSDTGIPIGEISLNEEYREGSDDYPCYVDMNF